MDAFCYVCNKKSTDFTHDNFTQLKSQHTETPICELIKTLLADIGSVRNIDDDSNRICVECLLQFDDYDWMKQETIEHEAKLRHLLLTTELKVKNTLPQIKSDIESGRHSTTNNGLVFADEFENIVEICVPESQTSPSHSSTSSSSLNRIRNFIPAHQSNYAVTTNDETALEFAKPSLSYVGLIALALKNSRTGSLTTSEMCRFMSEHFPYFKTASNEWKRSVRNSLSANKVFMKTGLKTSRIGIRTKFLWAMDPTKAAEIDEEVQAWRTQFESNVESAMAMPKNLPALMRGELKHGSMIDNVTGLDDIMHDETENEPIDLVASSEESMQSDCIIDAFGAFEEVIVEQSQSDDMQPARKRPRHDIESSLAATPIAATASNSKTNRIKQKYLRPSFTYSCLIALALKNAHTGSLLTFEICNFIREHFPYFQTATEDWKRNIRNFLSSSENFTKMPHKTIDGASTRKWLWTINPLKLNKLNEDIRKLSQIAEPNTMAVPGNLPALLRGELQYGGIYYPRPKLKPIVKSGPSTHPKPGFDNTALIALALKNSWTGALESADIFSFICHHFPYFWTAAKNWKMGVQSILRQNNYFVKIECKSIVDDKFRTKRMWKIDPMKVGELNARVDLQSCKNTAQIHRAMAVADDLPALVRGDMKHGCPDDVSTDLNSIAIDDSELESDLIGSIIDSEENIAAELFDEASNMFDGINIEDLLRDAAMCIDDGQTQFYPNDSHNDNGSATDSAETQAA